MSKLDEYKIILSRLDKASEYFSRISDEDLKNVEKTKEYELLVKLVHEANELYMDLKSNGFDLS